MKKKALKVILFVTVPIWIIPYSVYAITLEIWKGISEYINERTK